MMPAISKLFLPPPALARCLFAGVFRDTRGAGLAGADRDNHFPAAPLVSVTVVAHGALQVVQSNVLPAQFVMPPQEGPVTSWSAGDVTALTFGFYFDAWRAVGGDAACSGVPGALRPTFNKVQAGLCADPLATWEGACADLAKLWPNKQKRLVRSLSDWVHAAMRDAALSSTGRGVRSFERRLKRQSGHTKRALDFFANIEDVHRLSQSQTSATELAHAAGFADQSHMGRAVKRATGFSPMQLNKAIETQEAFWCYRLLGSRF